MRLPFLLLPFADVVARRGRRVLTAGLFLCGAALQAGEPRILFDVPGGEARPMLRLFAAQANREIVFAIESVEDVRTQPVKGEMTARAAIERMLAETGLVAGQDPKSGAFAVRRKSPNDATQQNRPAPVMNEQPANSRRPVSQSPQKTMNTKTSLSWLASLYALVATTDPMSAQSASAASTEAVVELSPFVVNSTRDTGYQAMSTLAGTRLDTPLKDLGASISIYTKEFLDDIGATNSGEFLIYATGMDAAGPDGNWGGSNDMNAATPPYDGQRENPQQSSRSRGLASPTFTRDLFISNIDIDSYNTERVTVLRGPNAALVGVSSPAGITDTTLSRADLRRNRNRVSLRIDENGGLRSTADFNRVLIPDKLAARLIGVDSREEYDQRPAFQHKERVYGSVTYKPFKDTTLRGNFESGRMKANQPQTVVPFQGISNEWYAAGRPSFDWTFYDDPARNPLAAQQNSSNFIPYYMSNARTQGGGAFYIIYNNPDDKSPSLIMQNTFPTTAGTIPDAIRNGTFHPLLNRDLAADAPRMLQTLNIGELPANAFWIGGNVLPGNLPGMQPPGIKFQSFEDFSAFDFRQRMMDESSRYSQNFHAYNITIEQSALENRVGVALAYDSQRQDRVSRANFFASNNNNFINIDPAVTNLDGLPNPNLGRPYVYVGPIRWTHRDTDSETMRATSYLKYDFKDLNDSWARWLGRHTLSGVFERYRNDSIGTNPRVMMDGPEPRRLVPNVGVRQVNNRVYVGPSIIGNTNPLLLHPIKVNLPFEGGPIGEIYTFRRAEGTTDPGEYRRSPVSILHTLNAGTLSREVIKSQAFTLQSYWLQDHVATVFGWRRDTDYYADANVGFVTNPNDQNDRGQTVWGFNDVDAMFPHTPRLNIGKETKSYSVVLKWPQKMIRLPAGMDLSVFYNDSENFTPVGGRYTVFKETMPPPAGTTKEYGFNVSAFDDKLFLRVNRFETANKFLSYGAAAFSNTVLIPVDRYLAWAREGNTNPHLVPLRQQQIATLLAPLPPAYLELFNAIVSGTAPNIQTTRNTNVGSATDTSDFTAKGTEFELVYNPTRNWRILANLAKQETVRSNVVPGARAFAALMEPVYAQLANVPAGNYPVGWQIGDPLPATVQTVAQLVDANSKVPLAQEAAAEGFPRAEQRKWRFNLVTNYSFRRGSIFGEKLQGWAIGGGIRWQSKFILGMPGLRDSAGNPVFDRTNPFYSAPETNIDAFVSYGRKVWGDRIDWKIQFNATNIYEANKRGMVPINAQPWGQYAAYRLLPQQRLFLTNTFSF